MTLTPGTRIGVYEITALLGEGGMGQVYRATDTRLKRQVAIKILPPAVAADADRLTRFQREAEVLAALNHPHIAAIYGFEESGPSTGSGPAGVSALVMELVEGEDLSQRLARGPIPLDEVSPLAAQIAEALEAAHEQGIIHRDLKPANIKVRADGTVKVLDFGLAKALAPAAASDAAAAGAAAATITSPAMTQAGMILGTAAYMSPEQAKGRVADKRSDVWAFGCVLYEMLTGQRAFKGEDVADTLAVVLRGEPDFSLLPPDTPQALRSLARACLRKNRAERIGDVAAALFVLRQRPDGDAGVPAPRWLSWRAAALAAVSLLLGAAASLGVMGRGSPAPPAPVTRLSFTLPVGQQLTINRRSVAISPDGSRIAYSANGGLFLRLLSEFDGRSVPGADPGTTPAFSPDGESLVFYADSAIKRISIGGGSPVTVCRVTSTPTSLSWTQGVILFSEAGSGLKRVAEHGGTPELLVDLSGTDALALTPQLLPDGDTLLFGIVPRASAALDRMEAGQIVVQSLASGERKTLIEGAADAQYVPTGHLVYVAGGSLYAVPFDLERKTVTGGAVPVVEGVRRGTTAGSGYSSHYAFSASGALVYVPGPVSGAQQNLMLFDQNGAAEALDLPLGAYQFPRVSPDGKWIAFAVVDEKETAVWIYGMSRSGAAQRLTFGGNDRYPVWSADSARVAFQSDREGDGGIFAQPISGGTAERLTKPDIGTTHVPESWSPDGKTLLFSATAKGRSSLLIRAMSDGTVSPFSDVQGSSIPPNAVFSPDGRWVAYQVGQPDEIEGTTFLQPYPPTGTKHQVARGGRPLWSRNGKDLFIIPGAGRLQVVGVTTTPAVSFTNPAERPRGFGEAAPWSPRTFDIMPDGRLLGVGLPGERSVTGIATAQIRIVINWFDELRRLVPVAK